MSIHIGTEDNKYFITQLKRNDEAAFRKLYDNTLPFLCSIIKSFGFEKQKMEDIIQEVYTEVWKQRFSLNEELSIVGLLKIITKRKIWRQLEADKKKQQTSIPVESPEMAFHDSSIEERDNAQIFERAVASLPNRQKEIFTLTRAGLPADEIATQLGISKRTTENLLFRARKNLMQYLKEKKIIN